MPKRTEDTDIDQYLYPALERVGLSLSCIRRNESTSKTGAKRGDVWISERVFGSPDFEQHIVALVECKARATCIDDADWADAKRQGKEKAARQGLSAYYVTNTDNRTRCYNAASDEEVRIDGVVVSQIPGLATLKAVEAQVTRDNSNVKIATFASRALDPKAFRMALWDIRKAYRACGLSKGHEKDIIKTTLTLIILKLISEEQAITGALPDDIYLWGDWRENSLNSDINDTIKKILDTERYGHLAPALSLSGGVSNDALRKVVATLSQFEFYDSDFDVFGLTYEQFANKEIKADFGEFYTPRHVISAIVRTALKPERGIRSLRVCDPCCGTAGFLVAGFLYLKALYKADSRWTQATLEQLRSSTFEGFDINDEFSIPYARMNMLMAGDGGTHIRPTEDSLLEMPSSAYNYILSNVPYGRYDGSADIGGFSYGNVKRYEFLFLERIVDSLVEGGRAAVIVPDGLIESTQYAEFRKNFLMDATVEAVVSLPVSVFEPYTTEKTYVLYFQRKKKSQRGRLQEEPIWHYIVDCDGFNSGKKRYPIAENDLPQWESGFCELEIPGKCGFVDMTEVCDDSFFSLSSEHYLRKPELREYSLDEYGEILTSVEALFKGWL